MDLTDIKSNLGVTPFEKGKIANYYNYNQNYYITS